MPKTKTPQHPNSRKAWKRSSLKGRLKLMQKTLGNIGDFLEEEELKTIKALFVMSDITRKTKTTEIHLNRLIEHIDKLFELNPIKTKD